MKLILTILLQNILVSVSSYKMLNILSLCESYSGAFGKHSFFFLDLGSPQQGLIYSNVINIILESDGVILYLEEGNKQTINCDVIIQNSKGKNLNIYVTVISPKVECKCVIVFMAYSNLLQCLYFFSYFKITNYLIISISLNN